MIAGEIAQSMISLMERATQAQTEQHLCVRVLAAVQVQGTNVIGLWQQKKRRNGGR